MILAIAVGAIPIPLKAIVELLLSRLPFLSRGATGAAHLHAARTVCRRAEPIGEFVIPYLNPLSDALFVMARYENKRSGITES